FLSKYAGITAAISTSRCAAGRATRPDAISVLLLRQVDLGSLRPWVNGVLHVVTPCVVVVDWLAAPPRKKLDSHILLRLLIFPTVYLAYVLIRGSQVGWYPYPFLNPARPGGYRGVVGYAAAIA